MKKAILVVVVVCIFGFGSSLFAQQGGDEIAIRGILQSLDISWNHRNTDSMALLVDEFVVYVDSDHRKFRGKKAYCERFKETLRKPALENSRSETTLRNLDIFSASVNDGNLAMADVQWRLTNIKNDRNQDAPDRFGHSKFVFTKIANGDWRILAHKTYQQDPDREDQVKFLFNRRQVAWKQKNVGFLMATVADDVVFESSNGETIRGKKLLREGYTALLEGSLKESNYTETVESVRLIQDDLALVRANWTSEKDSVSKSGTSVFLLRAFNRLNWKVVSIQPTLATESEGK